jgi:hypothetical protein
MKTRYTINQLSKKDSKEYLSDISLLRELVRDRRSDCTNYYSPMAERLQELIDKLEMLKNQGKKEL